MEMTINEKKIILRDLLKTIMLSQDLCALDASKIVALKTGLTSEEVLILTAYDCYGH